MTLVFIMIARRSVAYRPPLTSSGSTKFDRPQKTQAFSGPLELREPAALGERGGADGAHIIENLYARLRGLPDRKAAK